MSTEHKIYTASKTKHAEKWKALRADGWPIISTWIDEAGPGESADLADLWRRCIAESKSASVLVVYREPGEVLKGAWCEVGAALASGVKVFAVGIEEFTIASDSRISHFPGIGAAFAAIRSLPVPSEPSREDGGLLGLLQSLLQEPGSPPPIPTEAMAEFIIRDAASRLEHLENFKATVHSLLDEMGVRKYEGETCRIRRRLASLRTALRELAEVAKETSLDLSSMMDDASVGLASFTAPRGYLGDFESDIGKLGEVLAKHRELIDAGAPKKENP